ncbi:ESX secretion-associated protein EspG [Nocardia brasiliensis]|uniref:ESX secretion-associated protein EspG n=1 Tax=Nocardia brasiliensis TaxID=37326 RepID=UPI0024557095|nr:ESX secretion-associated protein EspG [Nocardia brasiliensis]
MTADPDPTTVDLNVDAALLLRDLAGIDAYPVVLALLPNIYHIEDRDRVRAVVQGQLTEAGIIVDGGRVHPVVTHWLQCLDRPDVELVARIADTALVEESQSMLRFSLVRRGDSHVLAVRYDDHVVIQSIFPAGRPLDSVANALHAALGWWRPMEFDPMVATLSQLADVPAGPEERRQALLALGATPHTAAVLGRELDAVLRRAEVVMVEHRDGSFPQPQLCTSVLDTPAGRVAVIPHRALDGQVWSTYTPGDASAVRAGVEALAELLPSGSWLAANRAR